MNDPVLLERDGHIGIVTLNDPDRRNAMTVEMLDAIPQVMADLQDDPGIRAVVVTGAGKSFCSGADFSTLPALIERTGLQAQPGQHAGGRMFYRAFLSLDQLEKPTIAAVNGAAVGGGLGIALLCDLRIVADDAKIGANFTRLGIHAGLGISHFLVNAVGYERAAELLFTGRLARGAELATMGFALESVPSDQVLDRAIALAAEIAESAPLSLFYTKRTLRTALRRGLADTLEMESLSQAMLSSTRDAREGIMAMMQKRTPEFKAE